jgi:hypothetical protein
MSPRGLSEASTFSAPKSVSLTALVGGDERVREAHRESVRVALGELERYTQARIGNVHAPETTGKFVAATLIDLHAGTIVWRDDQRSLRRLRIFLCYRGDAFLAAWNLMDAALPLQTLHGLAHLAARKLLDYLFQLRVFLADDLFELHRFHARVL